MGRCCRRASGGGPILSQTHDHLPDAAELLAGAPNNWGRWGPDDEIGALNYLTSREALDALPSVRQGASFTLGMRFGDPAGDPVHPGRTESQRTMVADRSHFEAHRREPLPGGLEFADDVMYGFLQGSTHCDALGHMWIGDQIYNGYDARTTIGGLAKAGAEPLGRHGMVGRGVLLDIARFRGKHSLESGETIDHHDLVACAAAQGVQLRPRTILLLRTGWIGTFHEIGAEKFYRNWSEPGLTYSEPLVRWFQHMEIPNLVTDTIANEVSVHPVSGVTLPLHIALMRNLGVVFTEMAWLDDLAAHCAADRQYDFLYVASPLKIVHATGAPVNPVALK